MTLNERLAMAYILRLGLPLCLLRSIFLFVPSILRMMGLDPAVASIARHFFKRDLFWDSGVFLLFGVARFH